MTIPEYVTSKKAEIRSALQTNGCSFEGDNRQKVDEFITFLINEVDGIYDISMEVTSLFNVSFEKADAVDQQIYKSIINPKYDEFVKYNEELRQEQKSGKTTDGQQKKIASFPRNDNFNKANFYFSPEDEEEIRKIMQEGRGDRVQGIEMEKIYDRVAEEVIGKVGIKQ